MAVFAMQVAMRNDVAWRLLSSCFKIKVTGGTQIGICAKGVVSHHEHGRIAAGIVSQDRSAIEPVAVLSDFSYGEIPHVCRNFLN